MKVLLITMLAMGVLFNPASAQTLFTITRHVNTAFTNNDFDTAINDVNQRFRIDNDRCSDNPCTARLGRSGNVGTFGTATDGLDVVTTDAELQQVFAQAGRVKVITALTRCGGLTNPSFIGCGRCPGESFIVESTVSGETYAHEFGHNLEFHNCSHRNDCQWNIMNATTDGTNDAVNRSECQGFGGRVNTVLTGNVYDGSGGPLSASGGPYWVTGNVAVPSGRILTIQGGTEIQFKHGYKITTSGSLVADGRSNRILLFSNAQLNYTPPPNQTLDISRFPRISIDGQLELKDGGEIRMP